METERIAFFQHQIYDLQKQQNEISRQIRNYKKLLKCYCAVYEAEAGVELQNEISPEARKSDELFKQ